jgi:hypothetical protein
MGLQAGASVRLSGKIEFEEEEQIDYEEIDYESDQQDVVTTGYDQEQEEEWMDDDWIASYDKKSKWGWCQLRGNEMSGVNWERVRRREWSRVSDFYINHSKSRPSIRSMTHDTLNPTAKLQMGCTPSQKLAQHRRSQPKDKFLSHISILTSNTIYEK